MQIQKPPVIATLFFCLGLAILFGLGIWQIQRMEWKRGILNDLQMAREGAQHYVSADFSNALDDYIYGSVSGAYVAGQSIAIQSRTYDSKVGFHILQVLDMNDGGHIVVNRGWAENPDVAAPDGPVTLTGMMRKPLKPNPFVPANDVESNIWFSIDLEQMQARFQIEQLLPYVLYLESSSVADNNDIVFHDKSWAPNDNHKSYAIFWFSMAGIMGVIFVFRFMIKPRSTGL